MRLRARRQKPKGKSDGAPLRVAFAFFIPAK